MPWSRKRNTAIVDEEKTSRAKIEDIEKLENTINAILESSPKLSGTLEKIVAIINFNRGMDLMIPRILGVGIGLRRVRDMYFTEQQTVIRSCICC